MDPEPLEEVDELDRRQGSRAAGKAQLTTGADRRNDIQGEARSRPLHRGCLPDRCPRRAAVVVRTHTGLVGKEHRSPGALGLLADGRILLVQPCFDALRIALIRTRQRSLRRQAQLPQQAANRYLGQADLEPLRNQVTHHRPRPQGKRELQLLRVLGRHRLMEPAHGTLVQLARSAAEGFGVQRLDATFPKRSQPFIDAWSRQPQRSDHGLRRLSGGHRLDCPKTHRFQRLV